MSARPSRFGRNQRSVPVTRAGVVLIAALVVLIAALAAWRFGQARECEGRGGRYVAEWSGWTCVAPQPDPS